MEIAPDGTIYAAAETTQLGDWDAFVSRFQPSNGRPDTRWAVGGFCSAQRRHRRDRFAGRCDAVRSTRARACVVRRGATLRVGMVFPGVNAAGALLQPILRSWRATSVGWDYAERSMRPRVISGRSVSTFTLRLAVGTHELEGWRNGSATLGHGRTNTLYVRVTA